MDKPWWPKGRYNPREKLTYTTTVKYYLLRNFYTLALLGI